MQSIKQYSMTPCSKFGGKMVSVLTLSVIDLGFHVLSGQTKDYKIGICCFSTNQ